MPVRGKPALIWLRKHMSAECCSRGPALSRSSREELTSAASLVVLKISTLPRNVSHTSGPVLAPNF